MSWFPVVFRRTGIGFSGHPIPAADFSLPHGRPTGHDCRRPPDRNGVTTFHTDQIRPEWVPPVSGGGGAHPADKKSPAGACRSSAASPTPRSNNPPTRLTHNETSTKVHAIHPPGLAQPVAPGWNGHPWTIS
jgi:hypothetical protein